MPASPQPPAGPLARLADLAVRRRGLMVIAWIVVLAATIALAPRVAGEFAADYSTPGADSTAAADLIEQRFPGTSAEPVEGRLAGARRSPEPAARDRIDASSPRPARSRASPTRASRAPRATARSHSCASARPALARHPAGHRQAAHRPRRREPRRRPAPRARRPADQQRRGRRSAPRASASLAALVILLVAFGSLLAAGLPLVSRCSGSARGRADPHARPCSSTSPTSPRRGGDDRHRRRDRLRAVHRHPLPRRARSRRSSRREAVVAAVATAGRSVLFAGGHGRHLAPRAVR